MCRIDRIFLQVELKEAVVQFELNTFFFLSRIEISIEVFFHVELRKILFQVELTEITFQVEFNQVKFETKKLNTKKSFYQQGKLFPITFLNPSPDNH